MKHFPIQSDSSSLLSTADHLSAVVSGVFNCVRFPLFSRAYKEADGGRNKAEHRVSELEAELKRLRADAEKRLLIKDDELQQVKKKLMVEIESLTVRLQEAESRQEGEMIKGAVRSRTI